MFNECLIHLFDCTCLNVMCVCSTIYGLIQKIFDHFICFLKWFLSFFVLMFSAYFVFQCLNMFCFEKQVSEFLATHFGYLLELPVLATCFGDLQVTSPSCKFTQKGFATHSRLSQLWNAQNQLFKELFCEKLVLNLSHPL